MSLITRVTRTFPLVFGAFACLHAIMANAEPVTEKAEGALEEIIVTAKKREQSLQDVPLAVSALSGEQLKQLGLTDPAQIALQIPGFQWGKQAGNSSPQVWLRGVGALTFFQTSGSPVSLYSDGVVLGTNAGYGFSLLDLERVEVLKGPQGTLYGRNTTGGLINLISVKPVVGGGTEGYLRAKAGNFDLREFEGAVGFSAGDKAAVRLSALSIVRDSWVNNQPENAAYNTGGLPIPSFAKPKGPGADDIAKIDMQSVRAQVAVAPSEDLYVLFNLHAGKDRSHRVHGKLIGFTDYTNLPTTACANPGLGGPCSDMFGFVDSDNSKEGFYNRLSTDEVDQWGGSVTLDWAIGDLTLTSLTSYDEIEREMPLDGDLSPNDSYVQWRYGDYDQFSQEIRLASPIEGRFRWMIGGYYFSSDQTSAWGHVFPDYASLFGVGFFSGIPGIQDGTYRNIYQDSTNIGLFANLDYDLTDALTLSVGLRIVHDERDVDYQAVLFNATDLPVDFITFDEALNNAILETIPLTNLKEDWQEPTGRITLDYQVQPGLKVFGSIAQGFKGGEVNAGAFFWPELGMVDPEYLTSYEFGLKSDFWNGRARLNLDAFYYDVKDQQVSILDPENPGVVVLANAGKQESKGVEAELQLIPLEDLQTNFYLAWLDAEYTQFETGIESYTGNTPPQSPEWSFSGLVRYTFDLAFAEMALQTSFSYTDDVFWEPNNSELMSQEGFWLFNASAEFMFPDKGLVLRLWVNNLTDEEYYSVGIAAPPLFGLQFAADPRTYGATLEWNF